MLIITHGKLIMILQSIFQIHLVYRKPKESNANWGKYLFKKQDMFTCEVNMNMLFNIKY
jgi:hypothetical protein